MYYYIRTNAYDFVATPDYYRPHGYKTFTVDFYQFDPRDYVMLSPRTKHRCRTFDYTFEDVEEIKNDSWEHIESKRDRAAELFIYDQFVRDPLNVSWDEVDGDLQELLDSAEWYITVVA